MNLRLVVFDVDGTLVDSQADIVASVTEAFITQEREAPSRSLIVSTIGMSLPATMARLAPDSGADGVDALVEAYKQSYMRRRAETGSRHSSPLFPGARDMLDQLNAQPETLLAVATGKSRRGLRILIEGHGLGGLFQSHQCADDHPSKPHPSMLLAALSETGIAAQDAVMVGDTTYDRDMAAAAGVAFIGVSWGYHPATHLGTPVINSFAALPDALAEIWSNRA
ncbi:MAG: HAD-IA family hydrolase [Pseudomonadota bacterium]